MPELAAPILAIIGVVALLCGVAWLTLRAAGHVGAPSTPTRAEVGTLSVAPADTGAARRPATRVRDVAERSAAIHQSVTRLADDERLRDAEQRVNALDAMIGAQQARRDKERHRRDTEAQRAIQRPH